MPVAEPDLAVRFARSEAEIQAAQRLRYQVFIAEKGGDGPGVDHDAGLERDEFDPFCDHLLLLDKSQPEGRQIAGVYRLLSQNGADQAGGYYSSDEFDLSRLFGAGRRLLELGRTCLHPAYRGGGAMFALWSAIARYVDEQGVEILFGTASFAGTDLQKLAQPLAFLHHNHLAPENLRVTATGPNARAMDIVQSEAVERRTAMMNTPALIKGYLRLGGFVGQGAWIDHAFKTTDICMILDTSVPTSRQALYRAPRRAG